MSNRTRAILLVCAIVLILGGAITYSIVKTKLSAVPEGTVGNTAGNLNNNGLFCEQNGMVYFANPYDDGRLYSMKSDGTELTKLCDIDAKYINAGGDYVFFFGKPDSDTDGIGSVVSKPGIYRINKNGDHLSALTAETSQDMVLVGNKLYYQHYTESTATTFAVLDLSKSSSRELLNYMINPSDYYQGSIYYNGTVNDHHLYRYDLATETESLVWEGDVWNPIYNGQYVYYMDIMNDYRLCRYRFDDNTIEVLTDERLDSFNIYGDIIYYQVSSSSAPMLKRMKTDGSEVTNIASGVFTNINITSTYTYFNEFSNDFPLYRTPTYGASNVEEFTAARDVLLENLKK